VRQLCVWVWVRASVCVCVWVCMCVWVRESVCKSEIYLVWKREEMNMWVWVCVIGCVSGWKREEWEWNTFSWTELKTLTRVTGDALRPDVKSVETSGQLKSLVTSVPVSRNKGGFNKKNLSGYIIMKILILYTMT
jgi:hypothetical protein